jgi:hypothetical protein
MVELPVPIQNHVAVRASFGKGLAELLDHPLGCRMTGHIAVKVFRRPWAITKKQ